MNPWKRLRNLLSVMSCLAMSSTASHPGFAQSSSVPQIPPFTAKPDFDHGAGHTFTKQFSNAKAGSYAYHCRVHSDMTGTVVVSGAPLPAFTVAPAAPFAGDNVAFDTGRLNLIGNPAQQPQVFVIWHTHPVYTLDELLKLSLLLGVAQLLF